MNDPPNSSAPAGLQRRRLCTIVSPPGGAAMTGDNGGGGPVRGYFRRIRSDYQKSVEREAIAGVHRRIREVVEPALRGVVFDLGSGGVTEYRTGRIELLISMDNVLEFLKNSQ